ncbi:Adenosylcobinamide-phosphate guanylyltransferase [Candidatus Burkholderia pumila]|uniref:Bifunctional adenosylcobalamin biosynthesis protein n=1 Tax=Candidatus Burkholderia pumila TaxID=1090375 RepID=A0ABR5HMN8_9BURK|nr:Adenosylcobinamide-phosphate guanylyltransferase [Candidatus Burkholderia pumila]
MNSRDLTFVLGGARSGKSVYAERLADESGLPVTYIATARIGNDEFAERVRLHRVRRPAHWRLVEAPVDLAGALKEADREGQCVLIDCLTLWLANLFFSSEAQASNKAIAQLLRQARDAFSAFDEVLARTCGKVIIVSNEIGFGVVPLGSVTRLYVDELGRLNQRTAAASTRAVFMAAGLPLTLKG